MTVKQLRKALKKMVKLNPLLNESVIKAWDLRNCYSKDIVTVSGDGDIVYIDCEDKVE